MKSEVRYDLWWCCISSSLQWTRKHRISTQKLTHPYWCVWTNNRFTQWSLHIPPECSIYYRSMVISIWIITTMSWLFCAREWWCYTNVVVNNRENCRIYEQKSNYKNNWVLLSTKACIDGSLPRKSDNISRGSFASPGANTCRVN